MTGELHIDHVTNHEGISTKRLPRVPLPVLHSCRTARQCTCTYTCQSAQAATGSYQLRYDYAEAQRTQYALHTCMLQHYSNTVLLSHCCWCPVEQQYNPTPPSCHGKARARQLECLKGMLSACSNALPSPRSLRTQPAKNKARPR